MLYLITFQNFTNMYVYFCYNFFSIDSLERHYFHDYPLPIEFWISVETLDMLASYIFYLASATNLDYENFRASLVASKSSKRLDKNNLVIHYDVCSISTRLVVDLRNHCTRSEEKWECISQLIAIIAHSCRYS